MKAAYTYIKQYYFLLTIILVAFAVRWYFQIGHIFSDDAYYSYLSYSLHNGDYTANYLGYPVFPLRVGFTGLTSISMTVFGTNEFATVIFPFLFSMLNILLAYNLARIITNSESVSNLSALFIAFFPTDIIFASIGFPDLINVFFINLGIYFLLKSYLLKKNELAIFGGISFFLSMQLKETIYYFFILLLILTIYFFIKEKKLNYQLIIGILFIFSNYFIEGFVYLFLHEDFLYRVYITNLNYGYSYYDFFPYTAQKLSGTKSYVRNLIDQLFLINAKSIFLRRFYLFLPLIAALQSFLSVKKKEHTLLLYWFWGTAILLIAFTTSFSEYKPLDLARSWYVYPLISPVVILTAVFISRFSKFIRNGLIVTYILGSLIMCFEYEKYFDKENLVQLKRFLRDYSSKMIYTDHFTKYSVDLIRGYEDDNSKRILGKDFNYSQLNTGEWILYNKRHIEELEMQKFQFPDFSILNSKAFRKVASFNDFVFYEKVH